MTPEMLRERFEYLLEYHRDNCPIKDCPECMRMYGIEQLLEWPRQEELAS